MPLSTQSESKRQSLQEELEFQLVPARLDLSTSKTQLCVFVGLAILLCLGLYYPAAITVMPSSDLEALKTINVAAHTSAKLLPSLLSDSRLLQNYAFSGICSLFLDSWIFNGSLQWYHIENVLLVAIATVLVAQVTAQIATVQNNRLAAAPAIWAGVLFCVYPIHLLQCSSIAYRAQLILTVTYGAAIFFYVRFRMLRQQNCLWLSLAASSIAYTSNAAAWTLPVVITLTEFLLLRGWDSRMLPATCLEQLNTLRFAAVTFSWALLFFMATVGMLAPNVIPINPALQSHKLIIARDRIPEEFALVANPDLSKLTEQNQSTTAIENAGPKIPLRQQHPLLSSQSLSYAVWVAFLLAAGSFGARALTGSLYWRTIVFVILWSLLGLLASSTINAAKTTGDMVTHLGLSSMPLAMLLPLIALPTSGSISRRLAGFCSAVGVIALSILVSCWLCSQI